SASPVYSLSSTSPFLHPVVTPRDLHSFPTRRSSDLALDVMCVSSVWLSCSVPAPAPRPIVWLASLVIVVVALPLLRLPGRSMSRSVEHTSELESQSNLVCCLLLPKDASESASSVVRP